MSLMRNRSTAARLLALAAGAALVFGGAVSASASGKQADSLKGLKILMTNDDSMRAERPNNSDGLGLYELRRSLCAAGADVVVIAPWQVQSGRGTAVTNSGVLRLADKPLPAGYENDCAGAPAGGKVFGLCLDANPCTPDSPSGTPSDTVKFALRGGLKAVAGWDEPDLVVTGPNAGLNVASSVNDSGTIGAAVAAIDDEIPAVAFSTSANADNSAFPVENYRATADWAAKFLVGLRKEKLLGQNEFAVSVNYPNISDGDRARRPVWTTVGDSTLAYHSYAKQEDGSYQVVLDFCSGLPACEETKPDADVTAVVDDNHIGVGAITWDRTYGQKFDRRTLNKVQTYVERRAPRP